MGSTNTISDKTSLLIKIGILIIIIGEVIIIFSTFQISNANHEYQTGEYENQAQRDAAEKKVDDAEDLQILLNFLGSMVKLIGVIFLLFESMNIVRNSEVASSIRVGFVVLIILLISSVYEQSPVLVYFIYD